jgi:hypothetical protein
LTIYKLASEAAVELVEMRSNLKDFLMKEKHMNPYVDKPVDM